MECVPLSAEHLLFSFFSELCNRSGYFHSTRTSDGLIIVAINFGITY